MVGNQLRGECRVQSGLYPSLSSNRVKAACTVPLVPGHFRSIIQLGVTRGKRGGEFTGVFYFLLRPVLVDHVKPFSV